MIRALANHALNEDQLSRLGRAITEARVDRGALSPLAPFRLGIVSNGTIDLLAPMLVASAARHGLALECVLGTVGQTMQDALI